MYIDDKQYSNNIQEQSDTSGTSKITGYTGSCAACKIVINFPEFGQEISLVIQNQVGHRFCIKQHSIHGKLRVLWARIPLGEEWGSELVPTGSLRGQPYLLLQTVFS